MKACVNCEARGTMLRSQAQSGAEAEVKGGARAKVPDSLIRRVSSPARNTSTRSSLHPKGLGGTVPSRPNFEHSVSVTTILRAVQATAIGPHYRRNGAVAETVKHAALGSRSVRRVGLRRPRLQFHTTIND